jgi:hypothetical protein
MGTFVPHLRKLLLAFVSCLFYPQIFVFDMGWEWRSGLICPKLASKPRHDPPASASLVLLKVRTARAQLGFFFFSDTGAWTHGLHLDLLHQAYFCEGFFEIGSPELFAQAGLELWSSWSLPEFRVLTACKAGFPLFEPLRQPYCVRYFWNRVSKPICWAWHWTLILLISAFWVTRIVL